MTPENKLSRLAGLVYLIVVVTGTFCLGYVPSQIVVADDPHTTFSNIISSESLFRSGIASFLIMQISFLLLPLVLFQLLRDVNRSAAKLMIALAVISVPIGLISVSNRLNALSLLTDPYFAQVFTPEQLQGAVQVSLRAYSNGLMIASLFWGLWLLPFGYLVFKSGFLPKILGVFLMLGCLSYVISVFGDILAPHYSDILGSGYVRLPASIGEIGICLWLLLVGARRPKRSADRLNPTEEISQD